MAGATMDFMEAMLSQKPAIEVLGPMNFKMATAAGILSLTTISSSKKDIEYKCILEPGEDGLTKTAKTKQPIWEDHKTWEGLQRSGSWTLRYGRASGWPVRRHP